MRSSKMATGSGRAAIFLRLRNRGRKTRPRSWVEMTSGGRRDAREDVLQTSASSMSPVEVWLYFLVRLKKIKSIWSLASPRHYPSDWVSCPLTTTRKSTSLHMSKVVKNLRLRQAPTLLFFFFFLILFFWFFLTVLYNSLELLYSTVS